MMHLNLQFFGGRGSGGGRNSGGGGGGSSKSSGGGMSSVKEQAQKTFPSGTYQLKGSDDEYEISYKSTKSSITQYSDGVEIASVTLDKQTGLYRVDAAFSATRFTKSASEAAKIAFGTPSEQDLVRKKRK